MKNLIPLCLFSIIVLGAVGCDNAAKTSTDAPSSVKESPTAPNAQSAQATKNDATSDVRKAQIESDIRATEQRNDITGGNTSKDDKDLQTEVSGKLEANLPTSQLTINSKNGAITVTGTVANKDQVAKIEPLAKQIKGVKSVINKVAVAPSKTN
jgi:hyperosmotically inducible periplasmic protein